MDIVRVGIVSSVNSEKCKARVAFDDRDNLVTAELPVLVRGAMKNKEYWLPVVGEQVVVLFLPNSNHEGFIIGSLYNDEDIPPTKEKHLRVLQFEDGTTISYDTETHTLSIQCAGPINIKASGNVTVIGDVIADGISLKNHTHSGVHGVTSPPIGGS
ncbi:phage baseplate assembly protein V [Geobacillus kaustophilus]|uniref:phage baseplate assembly protein V n=1 Tax=Geobacillus kaustophilus TaxID=1462 RepID=UPI0005CD38A7|nr:phage baseplate assembly protein V [Geobacillus kaustophilus]